MKTMKKFLSMAALALMGAMMTGCSSDDNFDNPQQPENASKVVTLTTTVGFDASAGTRALTIDGTKGVKTFAENDQIAVVYKKKTGGATAVAVSKKLTTTDIASGSKSATFTVTLDDPDKDQNVTYIYPAAMAGETGVDLTKLNTQDGTLASLQTKYDLCTKSGAWDSGNLPSLTLENQLAILAIAVKNSDGSNELTGSITGLTVSDGTNTYSVTRSAAAGPIYVAIQPTTSADISVTATDGTESYDNYGKFLTGKTYEASHGYSVSWKMLPRVDLSTVSFNTVTGNVILTGTPSGNLTIGYSADNWEVTLDNVNPSGSKDVKISTGRNVNLKLKGTSRLTQILVNSSGKNLTIDKAADDGTLILQMGGSNSPINVFGTVYIKGGTVKARNTGSRNAVYSNLNITGGAVYLAAGVGYEKAVYYTVTGTLYGWNGSAWGNYSSQQYATTDNTSGNPSSWTW